jgi:hypothetical protein
MERISITDLEKMSQSKYVCTEKIKMADDVLGDKKHHTLEFDVFDGLAYCADFEGKELFMDFPKLAFIKQCKDSEKEMRKFLNLDETTEITSVHVLQAYNTLYSA